MSEKEQKDLWQIFAGAKRNGKGYSKYFQKLYGTNREIPKVIEAKRVKKEVCQNFTGAKINKQGLVHKFAD